MTTKATQENRGQASVAVHVVEPGVRLRRGSLRCEIGKNVRFSTAGLQSYFFARWEPLTYDALLVAAAVEFADKTRRRPSLTWQRTIELSVPVHDPERWNDKTVAAPLHDALTFLTGDRWSVEFYKRTQEVSQPGQNRLNLEVDTEAVIPFSNGLDSRAVAGLMTRRYGDRLVRVRLGSTVKKNEALSPHREAFTSVPYEVKRGERAFVESSARSRGFKFALISALAAYLANAKKVIVPESGQGALGPALVTVGQSYEDYRSHPLFTERMETFIKALFGHGLSFVFPQIWCTKAETLRQYISDCEGSELWSRTWSCWQQSRQVSVDHKKRHCGICAACMLRRLSVHAAGLSEPKERYVWENLSAATFAAGAAPTFGRTGMCAFREYAIAGTLHLDHLAALPESRVNAYVINRSAHQLGGSLGMSVGETRQKLDRLLQQHSCEWKAFMQSLGKNSFVADWALSGRS